MHELKRAMFSVNFTDSQLVDKINRIAHRQLEIEAKEYSISVKKQEAYVKEHSRGRGITRKTLYNIFHFPNHKVSINKAELILEALNSERRAKDKPEYSSYSEIGLHIWGNDGQKGN